MIEGLLVKPQEEMSIIYLPILYWETSPKILIKEPLEVESWGLRVSKLGTRKD